MNKHTLEVQKRSLMGRAVKKLRRTGITPANVFSKKNPSVNLQVDTKTFVKLFKEVGESTLIYLELEGGKEPLPVFIREAVFHPVTGDLFHITFNQVDLKEKVTAPVPLVLSGEAPAEKEKLGILVQQLDEVEVEALPVDMPENITLDVSRLSEVGSHLSVSDIKTSSKFTINTDPETLIAKIEPLAKEEKAETPVAPVEGEAAAEAPAGGEATVSEPAESKEEKKSE